MYIGFLLTRMHMTFQTRKQTNKKLPNGKNLPLGSEDQTSIRIATSNLCNRTLVHFLQSDLNDGSYFPSFASQYLEKKRTGNLFTAVLH